MDWQEQRRRRKAMRDAEVVHITGTTEPSTIKCLVPTISPRPRNRWLVSAIGAGLGLTSVGMNLAYAVSQSDVLMDRISWAAGAVLVEALALTMPSLALEFWRSRQRFASALCTPIAVGSIVLATWSNLDFVKQTAGDHSVKRTAIAQQRTAILERLRLAERERAAITEARSVAEINAAKDRLPTWMSTDCANADRCKRLVEDLARARHRDELDAEIRQDSAELHSLPAVSDVSPSRLRLVLFGLVPGALAGPVLMLARW
jgi:hypothetical protein